MIVPKYQNSAGRLLAVLGEIDPSKPLSGYLPDFVFSIEMTRNKDQRSKQTIAAMAEVHQMYHQFKEDLGTAKFNDDQREFINNCLLKIEEIIYTPAVNGVVRAMTDGEKAGLEFCATTFEKEDKLAENDIEAIRSSIQELQRQVARADVSPTLRKILLELIRLSEDAIARYNIHGARGLKKAFKGMIAELSEIYCIDTNEREDIISSQAWKKIQAHILRFDGISGKLMKYKPMIEKGLPLLLGTAAG